MKASHKTIEDELLQAATRGDAKAIAYALSTGANGYADNGISISAAAKHGHAEAVRILLNSLKEPTAFGVGAALTAILHGHSATLKTILDSTRCSEASLHLLFRHASYLERMEAARIIRHHAEAGRGLSVS